MFALTLPQRLPNFCSAIRATLRQRQIRQSPGLALNAHSGNEWGKIPVLTGTVHTNICIIIACIWYSSIYIAPLNSRGPTEAVYRLHTLRSMHVYTYVCRGVDFRGQPGHVPPIIEKRQCFHQLFIRSFIPAISIAPFQVLYYSEAHPTTARILYRSFTRSAQATAGKGLVQGPYVTARAGIETTTFRLEVIDSTKAPSRPSYCHPLVPNLLDSPPIFRFVLPNVFDKSTPVPVCMYLIGLRTRSFISKQRCTNYRDGAMSVSYVTHMLLPQCV